MLGFESLVVLLIALVVDHNEQRPAVRSDTNIYHISINNGNNSKISNVKLNLLPGEPKTLSYEIPGWKLPYLDSIPKSLLLAGSGVTLWTTVCIKLLVGAYHAKRTDTWGAWKEAIPEEILKELPQEELANELMLTIATRYHVEEKNHFSDFAVFASFFHDIDIELDRLQKYIRLHEWLSAHYLGRIFPAQAIALEMAVQKIRRLAYLRTIVPPRITYLNDHLCQRS